MDLRTLKIEIDTDPLARGYSGMTNIQIANSLNTANRTVNVTAMSGSEVLNNIADAEYTGLTDARRQILMQLLGIGILNPWGKEAQVLIHIFGAGSTTIANLSAARVKTVSRATELGLGYVYPGDIQCAKALV